MIDSNLPKWLIGDSADERTFVIHLHYPRFILEVRENYPAATELVPVMWIDNQIEYASGELAMNREPAQSMTKLMREAGDFYMAEIDRE